MQLNDLLMSQDNLEFWAVPDIKKKRHFSTKKGH